VRQVLRKYQEDGLAQILAAFSGGARSVLAVAPTGSGKTTVFGSLTADLRAPVLILVHRRELATQAANRLREFGVDFGMIMPGEPERLGARVQVASKDTLCRRPRARWPRAGLVIVDEAHLSTARTWQMILEHYARAKILGFTATPYRLSGKSLASAYDALVVIARPRELREQGHLCPYVGFSYKAPDLTAVEVIGEDYDQSQSAAAMSAITGDIVAEWLAHARDLSTVVFACTVEHSKALTDEFRSKGVAVEHLDGKMGKFQRDAILARVANGTTRVLCNVGIAIEGLDIPRLKCCVLARPTKSLARAIQMMGRVRRPWQGQSARIHDHAFVIPTHGQPDADRDYSLHAKKEKPPSLSTCSSCRAVYDGNSCPACGAEREVKPRGERELKTVEDAEQYAFSSEHAKDAATLAPPSTPADLRLPTTSHVERDRDHRRGTLRRRARGQQRDLRGRRRGEDRVYGIARTATSLRGELERR
jgi:DNA repair protein RadD